MAWYGDPPGSSSPIASSTFGASMPTAICRIYTHEGFRVTADGRKITVVMDNQFETKEYVQKIFPLQTPGGKLACSFGGTVGLGPKDSKKIAFAFARRTKLAARDLTERRPTTLRAYTRMLSASLYRSLLAVQKSGRIAAFDEAPDIVWVFLDGYFKGKASRMRVRFFHKNQILQRPDVAEQELLMGRALAYGSEKIFHEVFETDNPLFAPYRKPWLPSEEVTLEYAREMAVGYIRAFASPEAQRIDLGACISVGPQIRSATATQKDGFRLDPWI
jgi:hypothetical protein